MVRQDQSAVDRLVQEGTPSGSVVDLLAVGFSRTAEDATQGEEMARAILRRFDRMLGLAEAGNQELAELTGLDKFEILRAKALIEIGRRTAIVRKGEEEEISMPADVFKRLAHLRREKREHFIAILLDSKGKIERIAPIHVGTVNMSLVGLREVYREAIRDGASSIIVAHNHPSGDPTPSPEDIEVTKNLAEAGKLLDIPLLDHIIIGYDRYMSFSESGLI